MEQQCHKEGCHDVGSLRCSRCKVAKYCSKECQKDAWKQHKKQCKSDASQATGGTDKSTGAAGANKPDGRFTTKPSDRYVSDKKVEDLLRRPEDFDDTFDKKYRNDTAMQNTM